MKTFQELKIFYFILIGCIFLKLFSGKYTEISKTIAFL